MSHAVALLHDDENQHANFILIMHEHDLRCRGISLFSLYIVLLHISHGFIRYQKDYSPYDRWNNEQISR